VSLGCIRMLNDDVIKLFNMVNVGTPVIVKAN
jgi:lipoprotein-anchoring transpeptidase ErfK/SrfK